MSKRYIIEIDEEPLVRQSCLYGETAVYKATRFNTLVFDEEGLRRLKPYEEDEGAEKAWSLAQRILETPSRGGMDMADVKECFGTTSAEYVIKSQSYAEAAKKYAEWKSKQKDQIRIGDEVAIISNIHTFYGIVTSIGINKDLTILTRNGYTVSSIGQDICGKTGRHFDIKSILDQIGERDGNA